MSPPAYLERFRQWFNDYYGDVDSTELSVFTELVKTANGVGFHLDQPADFAHVVAIALRNSNFDEARINLRMLDQYTTFQIQHAPGPEGLVWLEPSKMSFRARYGLPGLLPEFGAAIIGAGEIDNEQAYETLQALPIVAKIGDFLAWLREPLPVTFADYPRSQQQLDEISQILGIEWHRHIVASDMGPTVQASETLAWWKALQATGSIDISFLERTARPGSLAEALRQDQKALDQAVVEAICTHFIAEYFVQDVTSSQPETSELVYTMKRLLYAMTAEPARPSWAPEFIAFDDHDLDATAGAELSNERLERLTTLKMLRIVDGNPVVPQPLWPVMIEGLYKAAVQLQTLEAEERDFPD